MLAFKVSTVEACVLCVGKLIHVTFIIVIVHGHMHVAHTVLIVMYYCISCSCICFIDKISRGAFNYVMSQLEEMIME